MKTYHKWKDMLYTEEEFQLLYEASRGFNDDVNPNHPIREDEEFLDYMDDAMDTLLRDDPEFVSRLL